MLRQLMRGVLLTRRNCITSSVLRFRALYLRTMSENHIQFQRLPRSIQPLNYKLDFVPNFGDFSFSGNASVKLKVNFASNCLRSQYHAKFYQASVTFHKM